MKQLDHEYDSLLAAVRHHGILMLLAWGFVLPVSIVCSIALRRRSPNSLVFFRVHYIIAALGMILAIAGTIIGFKNFDTFQSTSAMAFAHGLVGAIVMCLAIVSILLYPCMGKPQPELRTIFQRIVAVIHSGLGYSIVLLGWITCAMGTRITWIYDAPFLKGFIGCLALFFFVAAILWIDLIRAQRNASDAERRQLLPN